MHGCTRAGLPSMSLPGRMAGLLDSVAALLLQGSLVLGGSTAMLMWVYYKVGWRDSWQVPSKAGWHESAMSSPLSRAASAWDMNLPPGW